MLEGDGAGVGDGAIDVCEGKGEEGREEEGKALGDVVVPVVSAVEDG